MAGRKSNVLKSHHDTAPKPKQKRKASGALNALAIAEHQFPTKTKVRAHRLGEVEDIPKRKRDDEDETADTKRRRTGDDTGSSDNYGSDSEGHEWKVGEVGTDDDSDIDSDEAWGSSDEERFEDFTFRGSSTKHTPKSKRKSTSTTKRDIDLSENSDSDAKSDGEDFDDDLGDDAVDLATAWDMNEDDEESEGQAVTKNTIKRVPAHEQSDEPSSESDYEDESSEEDSDSNHGSDLSLSDEEDGIDDGLSKLQDFVSSLETAKDKSKNRKEGRGQENGVPTEYGLTSSKKLSVSDLLSSVMDSRLKGSLKHLNSTAVGKSSKSGSEGKLSAPLPKRQQDKIDRAAAYEKSKETLNRWIDTVKANREAEHISFPLHDPHEQQVARLGPVEPKTDLESTIQEILVESGLATNEKGAEKQLQAAEELETRKMSLEEVRARTTELRKRRDLLFREELRAKRIKKIKSKSYRRVHRKEREKLEEVERQAMIDAGIDPDEKERELFDRRRAEARMGTKHKDSKWAKSLKETGRAAWDEGARDSMVDMARRDEELQRRIEGRSVKTGEEEYLGSSSSESENENDVWDEEADASDVESRLLNRDLDKLARLKDAELTGPHSKLLSMSFMQKAEASRKQQNDEEIKQLRREINGDDEDVSEEEEGGRRKFGAFKPSSNLNTARSRGTNEFEETIDSGDERIGDEAGDVSSIRSKATNAKLKSGVIAASAKTKKSKSIPEDNNEVENPWLVQSSRTNRKRNFENADPNIDISVNDDEEAAVTTASNGQKSRKLATKKTQQAIQQDSSDDDSDDGNSPVLLTNHDLVKRAFAGDDVVQDFEREKQDVIEEEGDKIIDNTLPGWGSWTGAGISKKQQKRQKRFTTKIEGIKPEQRKDAKLGHVIINEKRVKKNVQYMATQLPHPFENKQQYERSLRQPIGPEWSTSDTFHESTKPRVLIRQGIIKPMQRPLM